MRALTGNRFVRAGWTFAGWADGEGSAVSQWADGAVVNNLTEVAGGIVNLYAVWTENAMLRVLYGETETHVNVEGGEVAPYAKGKVDRKTGAFAAKVTATVQLAGGTKWTVAGGAKAGKPRLAKGTAEIDRTKSKFTDNRT